MKELIGDLITRFDLILEELKKLNESVGIIVEAITEEQPVH